MNDKKFCIDYAKRAQSACRKCKVKIDKEMLRIAKIVPNHFSDSGGDMKQWFHIECLFEQFSRARATTKVIEEPEDIDGWSDIRPEDKKAVMKFINDLVSKRETAAATQATKKTPKKTNNNNNNKDLTPKSPALTKPVTPSPPKARSASSSQVTTVTCRDNSFKEFRKLCAAVYDESGYNKKSEIIHTFLTKGSSGKGFEGDTYMWIKLLLPMVNKRIYNLQSRQLIKLFSRIFGGNVLTEMMEDLEQGDVAQTVATFFENSEKCPPAKKCSLSIHDVDRYLERLSDLTKEDDQVELLESIARRCTANDLKMIVRLIKHDIRINAGPRHVLDGLHPDAFDAFQASLDLEDVVRKCLNNTLEGAGGSGGVAVGCKLLVPMRPMLAEACGDIQKAFARCPKGMYSEIKYDGERVQLHKKGDKFLYFSRSLKPVVEHKVKHFSEYIPQAFKDAKDLILDGEILLVNTKNGDILPFGTLGVHKKEQFRDACVCLFVFDCLYYNDHSLLDRPLKERREILLANMKEVKNRVMFSEMEFIKSGDVLKRKIKEVLDKGLEGLVLKNPDGIYEPGKRRWLKVKKDYLAGGAMADSADLVVLGAYYGTGNKGGMMSIFLMGCYDEERQQWCTVTKVHGGHDDDTLKRLQSELKMTKISRDPNLVPTWLDVKSQLVPDFVATKPHESQVWEITGAEFTRAEIHTADGISIRFPRVARIRNDKDASTATTLQELRHLVDKSREKDANLDIIGVLDEYEKQNDQPSKGKRLGQLARTATPSKQKHSAPSSRSSTPRDLSPHQSDDEDDNHHNNNNNDDNVYDADTDQELPEAVRKFVKSLSRYQQSRNSPNGKKNKTSPILGSAKKRKRTSSSSDRTPSPDERGRPKDKNGAQLEKIFAKAIKRGVVTKKVINGNDDSECGEKGTPNSVKPSSNSYSKEDNKQPRSVKKERLEEEVLSSPKMKTSGVESGKNSTPSSTKKKEKTSSSSEKRPKSEKQKSKSDEGEKGDKRSTKRKLDMTTDSDIEQVINATPLKGSKKNVPPHQSTTDCPASAQKKVKELTSSVKGCPGQSSLQLSSEKETQMKEMNTRLLKMEDVEKARDPDDNNFLRSIKVHIPASYEDRYTLWRHIVGFGGIPLNDEDSTKATHYLLVKREDSKEYSSKLAIPVVDIKWMVECCRKRRLLPVDKFRVDI